VGPPPLVEGPLLSPGEIVSDYHVETNPLLAPGPPGPPPPTFPPSLLAFATPPAQQLGGKPPPPPPREHYPPPLENRDALPAGRPPLHPEAKSLGRRPMFSYVSLDC
jgi:hypothetical protein